MFLTLLFQASAGRPALDGGVRFVKNQVGRASIVDREGEGLGSRALFCSLPRGR